jgi:hypothetical protein
MTFYQTYFKVRDVGQIRMSWQMPRRPTPRFDDAHGVSVGPVDGEFGAPWAALETGESFRQVAGM